jgi:HlyD family secretion protein
MRYLRNTILLLLFLALIGGSAWALWVYYKQNESSVLFRVEPVTRGSLLVTIEASGTLMPEEVVDVGARVAGKITKFGVDPRDSSREVDYSTDVEEGTILAYIDDLELSALVDEANANLARAKASRSQAHTQLKQAQRNRLRVEDVRRQTFVPDEEYDAVVAAHEAAESMLEVAEADV